MCVNDILMESSSNIEIDKLKEILNDKFKMKDLDETKRILGIDIMRNCKRIELLLFQSGF